jgi:prepilin-type N-terminal cleavage/methylation domain-containing protein
MEPKGFTLIELLIGLLIFAIGILGVASMHIASVKGNIFTNNLTQAAILAQDKLEHLKYLSYDDSKLRSGEYNEGAIPDTIFLRQYHVAEDKGNSIKTITVTVQWIDRFNHNLTLTTIRAK